MRNIRTLKLLIIIFVLNILESFIAPHLINFYISLPITFLVFSLAIYNSNRNSNPLFAFLCGFYLDLISGAPFGVNAGIFTMMSYVINSYANTFKLFSYIQICIFFAVSSVFYLGFKNLIIGLENFSYSVLFVSLFFNTLLFLLIAMLRYYFPSMSIKYD
jgi:rod shape-determining protein MreD